MSFGFGIGDFLGVGTLVWNVYNAYAGAPEQFRNFSQEILSLHVVFRKVEDQLCNGINTLTLSTKDKDDLKILHDGLQTIVKELDALLGKYQSLTENHSVSFDRLRWGQEDLVGFRERIVMHIGLLTAFNTSLMCGLVANQNASLIQHTAQHNAQHTAQLVAIQEQLGQIFAGAGLRRRGSVASLSSVASFALGLTQRQKAAWKELCTEFHCNGVTPEMIKAKKQDIINLFRSATAISLTVVGPNGTKKDGGDNTLQDEQGVKKDRAPWNNMLQTLSLSATRAQYYVAALSPSSRSRGFTALHVAVERGDLPAVQRLLRKSVSIEATDANNSTALHLAALYGHTEVVNALLEKGASIDATAANNWTALHLAAFFGHTKVVNTLLEKGASIDATAANNWTALHLAASFGHVNIVNTLLEKGASIDATDDSRWTALHLAAQSDHTEVVNALLEKGASIDATDSSRQTALHLAARDGHTEAVNTLLEKGASIDATDDSRRTALHLAAQYGYTEVINALLSKGANSELTTIHGKTALEIAQERGNQSIAKLLGKRATIAEP